ncbi:DUF5133 domain-containing protein [Streptomyces fodineus]|uniref:DUF5133 domain-containing protein n=1 Tax=Streptomyces fodineus TaxID=1904616 RepID=UPI0009A0C072|nr:DUF5133 domain-containing protein [Streptomyces fodineus]
MLLPAKSEVSRLLRRYRVCERAAVAAPADLASRAAFEDSGYTLCVLMGERDPREAAAAARRYLRTDLVTYLRERNGSTRAAGGRVEPLRRPRIPGRAERTRARISRAADGGTSDDDCEGHHAPGCPVDTPVRDAGPRRAADAGS